ncbi:MAG: hypothetical protein HC831_02085 [Chloroflexia bacterium]|nr:hypothetical protein [Chloroflexia bacterium]
MGFKLKSILLILSSVVIIYIVIFTFFLVQYRNSAFKEAEKKIDAYGKEHVNSMKADFNIALGITRALAFSYLSSDSLREEDRFKYFTGMLEQIFKNTSGYATAWSTFQFNGFLDNYDKEYGRAYVGSYKMNGKVTTSMIKANLDGTKKDPNYDEVKNNPREFASPPYLYSLTMDGNNMILVTSIMTPIMKNGKFCGLAGLDVTLDKYEEIIKKIKPYEKSIAYLVSGDGQFVAHPEKDKVGKNLKDVYKELEAKNNIMERTTDGEPFSFSIRILVGKIIIHASRLK